MGPPPLGQHSLSLRSRSTVRWCSPSPAGLTLWIKQQIKDQIWIFCVWSFPPVPLASQSMHCSCKSSLSVFGESQNWGFSLQSGKPRLNYFSNAVCNGYYPEFGCVKFSWFPARPHPGVCSRCGPSSLHKQAAALAARLRSRHLPAPVPGGPPLLRFRPRAVGAQSPAWATLHEDPTGGCPGEVSG